MKTKSLFSKILAITGTVLLWLPIAAMLILGIIFSIQSKELLVDYLIPAELFLVILAGGLTLLWAEFRLRPRRRYIAGGVAALVFIFMSMNITASLSGLASGETAPVGLPWTLVILLLILYFVAIIFLGVLGIRMIHGLGRQTEPIVTPVNKPQRKPK